MSIALLPRGRATRSLLRPLVVLALSAILVAIGLAGNAAPGAAVRCPVGQEVIPGSQTCAPVPAEPTQPPGRGATIPDPQPRPDPAPTVTPVQNREPPPAPDPTQAPPPDPIPTEQPPAPGPTAPPPAQPETPPQEPPAAVAPPEFESQGEPPTPQALIQPLGPEESLTVTVLKSGCNEGFDPETDIDQSVSLDVVFEQYTDLCVDPMPGTVFTLTDANGQNYTMPTSDSQNPQASFVSWYGAPPGFVAVYEVVPPGFGTPTVFCMDVTSAGPVFSPALDGGAIEANFDAGTELRCNWFNIPAKGVTVTVNKWLCPPGSQPDTTGVHPEAIWDAQLQFFADTCQEPGTGFKFTVQVDAPAFEAQILVTDNGAATGVTGWPGYPAEITISEDVSGSDLSPLVICDLDRAPGSPVAGKTVGEYPSDGAISINEVLDGDAIDCAWYNTEPAQVADPIGEVKVYARTCPDGIDGSGNDYATYAEGCLDVLDGVGFGLSSSSQTYPDTSTSTVAPFSYGQAQWDPVAPDDYVLSESQPSGDVVVFCGQLDFGSSESIPILGPVQEAVLGGNAVEITVPPDTSVVCAWFNLSPGGGDPGDGGDPDGGGDPGNGGDPTQTSTPEPEPTPTPDTSGDPPATPVVFALPSTGSGEGESPAGSPTPWLVILGALLLLRTFPDVLSPGRS
jgi:hypothetical protein